MGLFSRLSYVSRVRRLKLFYEVTRPSEQMRILDVGGEVNPDASRGLQLVDSYPWKKNVSVINLSARHIEKIKETYPEVDARVGDACVLPWPDGYFDVVYSNAVIEHVGDLNRQKKMAAEIMRVGKQWFVSTPNRWYPFEFHLRLPLVTWLPRHGYLWVGSFIRYSHVRKKYIVPAKRVTGIRLMTARKLKVCFPGSRIVKQRITFMAETLIAIGGPGVTSRQSHCCTTAFNPSSRDLADYQTPQ